MNNIVVFGATQTGKTTLLGYLATSMLRHPQFNEEVLKNLKLIKKLTTKDDFSIGNPCNPINLNKDIILPSFISLDKDELKKFKNDDENPEGSTKRFHHNQINICISDGEQVYNSNCESENILCTFIDSPGFRQRLTDKYQGFFEGDIGIAILKLSEITEFCRLKNSVLYEDEDKAKEVALRLFEPIRIWCDYRSPEKLLIVISQIDRGFDNSIDENIAIEKQIYEIKNAIDCIRKYINSFSRGVHIPISPISIKITSEENIKPKPHMSIFFKRKEENIYSKPKNKELPGDGTFISCLRKILELNGINQHRPFSMASVYKPMKASVNGSNKTSLNIHAIHGTIHKDDTILMGPVLEKGHNIPIITECRISSIKADGAKNTSENLLEGNAGGLIFNSIKEYHAKSKYEFNYISQKSDIAMLNSTILFSGNYKDGDIVELEIFRNDYNINDNNTDNFYNKIILSILPFSELILIWYGKKIVVNVVEKYYYDDRIRLSVILSKNSYNKTRYFLLPCDENENLKYNDSVLLGVPRNYYSSMKPETIQGLYVYLSCNIISIKNSENLNYVSIESDNAEDLFNTLKNGQLGISKKFFDEMIINIPIKKVGKNIDIYSVFAKINKTIRHVFDKNSYKDYFGNMSITLS